ncbi:MAG: helix-hairpin-helix domain-containing protein [Chitinispirillia bacterium]|nr:helix-hairpin-helix domain-containing protein [Chitinispirillia bacterium]
MRWANGLSILLWSLSAVFFIYSHVSSAQDSGSGEVIAIGSNGEKILLDTLLAGGQIGLVVGESTLPAADLQSSQSLESLQSAKFSDTLHNAISTPSPSSSKKQSTSKTKCLNINSATEAQLISIKGVGPVLAASIIRHRQEKGIFRKKEDLLGVKGIGSAKMEQIGGQVCF